MAVDQNLIIQLLGTARMDPRQTVLQGDLPRAKGGVCYGAFLDHVEQAASGLIRLDVQKGDRVAILAENRPEWTLADLSVLASGGVSVPMYNTLSPRQMAYELRHSQAKVLFLSSGAHLEALLSIRDKLPKLRQLIVFDEALPAGTSKPDMTLRQLMALGASDRRPLEILASRIGLEDPATIVYTSGATDSPNPRGVLLTHSNFLAERKALERVFHFEQGTVLLSYLPLAHILQRVVDLVAILRQGQLAYCRQIDRLQERLREVRPHILVGVPRTYEKIRLAIVENLFHSRAPGTRFYPWIFRWMEYSHRARSEGRRPTAALERPFQWLERLAMDKIREHLGGRIRHLFVAGAPLPRDLETFFEIIRIPLLNVYGMTELTGAATANCPDRNRAGTAGIPLPGVELKIQEDGEILVRGDTVMAGYYQGRGPPKRAVNSQGWFATGDLGRLDGEGFLTLTGRKKEILVTAAGNNIAAEPIEKRLRRHPFVEQTMVVGEARPYLTVLLVPSFTRLNDYALKHRILARTREELLEHPKVLSLYEKLIREVNRDLARFQTLKRFRLLPEAFPSEAGETTAAPRLRRDVIEKRYREEIRQMYRGTD